jgi:glycosyltransferase involved in cell wall biosynthesis
VATVVLIGNGPLPHDGANYVSFPQLRFEQFLRGLLSGGHCVRVVSVESDPKGLEISGDGWSGITVEAESSDWEDRTRQFILKTAPVCIVAAGPYNSVRLASLVCGSLPLWVDIPGDPFGEAQVKDALNNSVGATSTMAVTYAVSFARGDRFSAISASQRAALLGQLGLSGRLTGAPLEHNWVSVIPGAYAFGEVSPEGVKERRGDKLVVALVGGYNTWFDGDSLLIGLLMAMDNNSGLSVVSTGGAIPNHHNETYERFLRGALSSRHSEKFDFHGWVPHERVFELLKGAHVGVTMDRTGIEAELGARTRVLLFLHQGLEVITTTGSDFTNEMVDRGFALGVEVGDSAGLSAALGQLVNQKSGDRVAAAQHHLASHHSIDRLSVELNLWVSSPFRVDSVATPLSLVSSELEAVRRELREVYGSITWRILGRLFRAIKGIFRG